jgi:hypothetical protein
VIISPIKKDKPKESKKTEGGEKPPAAAPPAQ